MCLPSGLQFAFEETTYSVVESSGLVTVNISKLGQYESPISVAISLESGTARGRIASVKT